MLLTTIRTVLIGVIGYYVVDVILDALGIATKTGGDLVDNLIPLLIALAIVIYLISRTFHRNNADM